jgi:hypothetical protein
VRDVLERACRLSYQPSPLQLIEERRRTGPEIRDLSIFPLAFFFVGVLFSGALSFSFFSSFTLTAGQLAPWFINEYDVDVLAYLDR